MSTTPTTVTVYTKADCRPCAATVRFLNERGRVARGAQKPNTKLTPADIEEMRRLRATGETQNALASRFGVTQSRVSVLTRKDI